MRTVARPAEFASELHRQKLRLAIWGQGDTTVTRIHALGASRLTAAYHSELGAHQARYRAPALKHHPTLVPCSSNVHVELQVERDAGPIRRHMHRAGSTP